MVGETPHRPWLLVGPWYRWQRPGVPSAGRVSRPVFQKYDSPKLIEEFLRDPQHSLKFIDEDFVHEVRPLPALVPAKYKGKARRLSDKGYFRTEVRKLFLDTHKRFYLVVCELHCDAPGLPAATRDQVCEAGFVVRRRVSANLTKLAAKEAKPILAGLATARAGLGQLDGVDPAKKLAIVKKGLAPAGEALLANAVSESIDKSRAVAIESLAAEKAKFDAWAQKFSVHLRLQGWSPRRDRIGEWVDVEERPGQVSEQVFPLYPLIPDPREDGHSAKGRNLYFGLVPTASADTDDFGQARFDEYTRYEISCFVRRHRKGCPKKNTKPDCHGELVWSSPTETYRIAPHFDLVGTSNRPVSVQLPDLGALEAQAAALPPNQLAPFRMVSPPDSNLEISADDKGTPSNPGISGQICSFSIPLITIVATFVFKLFLPVVTLLFGLFFLLKLKLCIPPSIDIEAGVAAELKADLELGLDVSIDAKIEADFGAVVSDALDKGLGGDLSGGLRGGFDGDPANGIPARPALGPRALGQLASDVSEAGQEENAPSLTAKLEYEKRVEVEVSA